MYDGPLNARVLDANEIEADGEYALGATLPLMPSFNVEGLGDKLKKGIPIKMYSIPARGTFIVKEKKMKGIVPWFKVEVSAKDSANAVSKKTSQKLSGWFNGSALISIGVYSVENQSDTPELFVPAVVTQKKGPRNGPGEKIEGPETTTAEDPSPSESGDQECGWEVGTEVAFEDDKGNVVTGKITEIVQGEVNEATVDGSDGDQYIILLEDLTSIEELKEKEGEADGGQEKVSGEKD